MIEADTWANLLLSGTLRIFIAALAVAMLLRMFRPLAARTHRLIWSGVLLQGILIVPVVIALPVWAPSAKERLHKLEIGQINNASTVQAGSVAPTLAPSSLGDDQNAFSWQSLLVRVWGVGLIILIGGSAMSYLLLQSILRRSAPARSTWQQQLQTLAAKHASGWPVTLVVTDRLGPLLAAGRTGYRIAVPRSTWSKLSTNEREAVLLHELAHMQRHDLWTSLAIRMLAALHWFNPVAWWVAAKFDEAAEWACDARVACERSALATDLASALLSIADSRPRLVAGVVRARGSNISERVHRLLCPSQTKESVMKKLIVFSLIAMLLTTAIVRVQLVAREAVNDVSDESLRASTAELIESLDGSNDPLQQQFTEAMRSPAGQLVLVDQIEHFSQQSTGGNLISAVIDKHFQIDPNGATLKPESATLREQLLSASAAADSDLAQIQTACQRIADRLQGNDETTQLLQRFLKDEAGPVMLYVKHLRNHMHPETAMMTGPFGKVLAQRADGKLQVRPDAREEVSKLLAQRLEAVALCERLADALTDWVGELAPTDALHQRLKVRLADPMFAAKIVADGLFGNGDISEIQVDQIVDQLDESTIDTAKGIELQPNARVEVERVLDEFDPLQSRLQTLRPLIAKLREQFDLSDVATRGFSELLDTDVGLIAAAEAAGSVNRTAEELLMEMLNESITQSGDTIKLSIDDDKRNELLTNIQNEFREFRKARRQSQPIRDLADKLNDEPLADTMRTIGGMLVFKSMIEAHADSVKRESLEDWASELFEKQGDRRVIRETARPQIKSLLVEIANVEAELAKDDF